MGNIKGKLIKKEDKKSVDSLDIQAYPWLNFKEEHIVFPDNPRRSVILKKYHDPKEINDKIKEAMQFKHLLEKKSIPLYPIDLTDDYDKGIKELIKNKRRRLMGEEEAMALELAEIDASSEIQFRRSHAQKKAAKEKKILEKQEIVVDPAASPVGSPRDDNAAPVDSPRDDDLQSMDSRLRENDSGSTQVDTPPSSRGLTAGSREIPADIPSSSQDVTAGSKETDSRPRGHDEVYKQSFDQGYLDGFKNGEERAVMAQESKYETVFQNVSKVVEQIDKLKDSLYAESKDVFIEIIKLCAEKILREQIKYSDQSLFSIFDEVIKSISQKSAMKIELNPQDLIRMKKHIENLGIQDRVTLKEDQTKENGDFSIESERGVSIVSLQKTVESLVDKLKAELFSEESHEDSTKNSLEDEKEKVS